MPENVGLLLEVCSLKALCDVSACLPGASFLTSKLSLAAGHWQVKGWSHSVEKKEKRIRRTFAGPSVGSAVCLSAGRSVVVQNERK